MNKVWTLIAAAALGVAAVGCKGGDGAEALNRAAVVADSLMSAEYPGNVEVDAAGTGLDATIRVPDTALNVRAVGRELFEVYAAQQLKKIPAADVNLIADAVHGAGGVINVELLSPLSGSQIFDLTARRLVELQKARLSQLNVSVARTQVVAVADSMVPNPKAHAGALRVETSVAKSFLQYNVVWPSASAFSSHDQGLLTLRYFDALKRQYQALGDMRFSIVEMLTSMGIDGVRIVYSAEDSDRELRQAFPWREIEKPVGLVAQPV